MKSIVLQRRMNKDFVPVKFSYDVKLQLYPEWDSEQSETHVNVSGIQIAILRSIEVEKLQQKHEKLQIRANINVNMEILPDETMPHILFLESAGVQLQSSDIYKELLENRERRLCSIRDSLKETAMKADAGAFEQQQILLGNLLYMNDLTIIFNHMPILEKILNIRNIIKNYLSRERYLQHKKFRNCICDMCHIIITNKNIYLPVVELYLFSIDTESISAEENDTVEIIQRDFPQLFHKTI